MSYDAGSAKSTYILDITDAERKAAQLRSLFQGIAQDAAAFNKAGTGSPATAEQVKLQQALARTAAAQARLAAEANKRLVIDQKQAQSDAQIAVLEQRRATELQRTAAASDRAAQAALRRGQAEERAARQGAAGNTPLPRTFAGVTGAGLVQGASILGIGVSAQQTAEFVKQSADLYRETTQADRSLQALAGSSDLYAEAIKAAKEQQVLFGGSLKDNIEGLSGLVTVSRSAGVPLARLIDLSQRLAVLNPEQGISGARFALSEGLAGQTRSLATRFNIPLSELKALKDESIPVADRLKIIDQYLGRIGITSQTVTSTISDQARAYNRLNAELGAFQVNAGQGLANAFEGAATGLGRIIGLVNNNPKALAELRAIFGGKRTIDQGDINQAAQDIAQSQARAALTGTIGATRAQDRLGGADQFNQVIQQLAQLEQAGGPAAQQAEALAAAFQRDELTADQFRTKLAALVQQQQAGTVAGAAQATAADQAAKAQQEYNDAIVDAVTKGQDQAAQEQRVKAIKEDLAKVTADVKLGLYDQSDAAAYLNAKYPELAGGADALITKQKELAGAVDLTNSLLREQANQTRTLGTADASSPGRRGTGDSAIAGIAEEGARRRAAAQAQAQAQRDQNLALANTTQRLGIYRKDLADARAKLSGLTEGTAEYAEQQVRVKEAETNVRTTEQQLAQERSRTRIDKQASTDLTLQNQAEDHYRRLLQIQEDYQLRAARSEEDYNVRRGRDQEDYERKRRKLLAEGKRFEAEQLKQEFERGQKRDAEDFARSQRRDLQDEQIRIDREGVKGGTAQQRTIARAALRGVKASPATGTDVTALAAPAPALAGQGPPPTGTGTRSLGTINISGDIYMDAEKVGRKVYPTIELLLKEDAITVQVSSAPAAQPNAIGGPRP